MCADVDAKCSHKNYFETDDDACKYWKPGIPTNDDDSECVHEIHDTHRLCYAELWLLILLFESVPVGVYTQIEIDDYQIVPFNFYSFS